MAGYRDKLKDIFGFGGRTLLVLFGILFSGYTEISGIHLCIKYISGNPDLGIIRTNIDDEYTGTLLIIWLTCSIIYTLIILSIYITGKITERLFTQLSIQRAFSTYELITVLGFVLGCFYPIRVTNPDWYLFIISWAQVVLGIVSALLIYRIQKEDLALNSRVFGFRSTY